MAVFSFISFTRAYFTPHEGWRHISVHFVLFVVSFPSITFLKAFHCVAPNRGAVFLFAESYGGVRYGLLFWRIVRRGAVQCGADLLLTTLSLIHI